MSAELSNLEALALTKVKAPFSSPEPGKYEVDVTVRIVGSISVGKSTTAKSLPFSATDLAHALARRVSRATLEAALRDVADKRAGRCDLLESMKVAKPRAGTTSVRGLVVEAIPAIEAPELLLESAG